MGGLKHLCDSKITNSAATLKPAENLKPELGISLKSQNEVGISSFGLMNLEGLIESDLHERGLVTEDKEKLTGRIVIPRNPRAPNLSQLAMVDYHEHRKSEGHRILDCLDFVLVTTSVQGLRIVVHKAAIIELIVVMLPGVFHSDSNTILCNVPCLVEIYPNSSATSKDSTVLEPASSEPRPLRCCKQVIPHEVAPEPFGIWRASRDIDHGCSLERVTVLQKQTPQ
jgi:hypothetical protein